MKTTYGRVFARLYNLRWTDYACRVAPKIESFYARTNVAGSNQLVLDLCCGTGQLARYFLDEGYRVVGLDLSGYMLSYAVQNNYPYTRTGQARFILGDIARLPLQARFGLIVSTYYSLNHLKDMETLQQCFESVFINLMDGGIFIFDLSTRIGEMRWNNVSVKEDKEALIFRRGSYDGKGNKSHIRISGFLHTYAEAYERFDVSTYNSVFELKDVKKMLLDIGWRHIYFSSSQDLGVTIEYPEKQERVFVLAMR